MTTIALLILGKSDRELEEFLGRSPGAEAECQLTLVANPNKHLGGYAAIANPFLERIGQTIQVVGVAHADTVFEDGAIAAIAGEAIDPENRITGIVGRSVDGRYIWGRKEAGEVSTLDSCSVFMPTCLDLRFDGENFDDFHCLVEDLCLQAGARGIRSFVPRANADHIGGIDRAEDWLTNYQRYRQVLMNKWCDRPFTTT